MPSFNSIPQIIPYLGSYTWANRPSATANANSNATDYKGFINHAVFVSPRG